MPRGLSINVAAGAVSSFRWGTRLRPLAYADVDARAFADLATARAFDSVVLSGPQARFDVVHRSIASAAATLGAGDTFILTFSGHGLAGQRRGLVQQSWCLFDDPLMRFGNEGLDALLARFAEDVRVLVVSNCCHSGAPGGPTPLTPPMRAQVVRLSACAVGETTISSEDGKPSTFVSRVLDAAQADGGFTGFFDALSAASGDSSPQLEIAEPVSESFLAAGPFRFA
jgi:hypothetical protein